MTRTMRAVFVKAPFNIEIREVPVPDVKPGWALIKVEAGGICGTDMHFAATEAKDWMGVGHEVAGVVTKIGSGVPHVKEGDRVVLESGSFNRFTDISRDGRVDLDNSGPNIWLPGAPMGFADYILAPAEAIVPYSDLTPEVACLAEPLGVAIDMTYVADIHLGNEVLVLGLGAIGLMAIPVAKMKGAGRLYAVNRSGGKRAEVAAAIGADEVILTAETPLENIEFRKGGVDRALVSADPKIMPDVFPLMNYGGYVSFIGINWPDGDITFNANDFHFKKLQLRASHAAPALYFPTALQLMRDRHVDGEQFISHVLPLDEIERGFDLMRNHREDVLKVVVKP
ncbi:MAG: zinc-binding dehydrogenase [Chloroflexota bacterium]